MFPYQEETKMEVQRNRTSSWSSADSHPSDNNKDVRWMGHSFISRGSAMPVEGSEDTGSRLDLDLND
jgi:hypothetical protein